MNPTEPMSNQWISVEERLPEPMVMVRIFIPELAKNDPRSDGSIVVPPGTRNGYYLAGHLNEWRMDGSPSQWDVTHWMPLPEPPRS